MASQAEATTEAAMFPATRRHVQRRSPCRPRSFWTPCRAATFLARGGLGGVARPGRKTHRRSAKRAQAHIRPREALADERRQAQCEGGGDLDRLQDDAVGER